MVNKIALRVFSLVLNLAIPAGALADVGDTVSTDQKVISEVLIQVSPTGSSYYFATIGGWGAPGCPNVIYPYIDRSMPGADAVLSAALAARSTGKPIGFAGICGDTSGQPQYIQIRTVHF